MIPQLCTTVGQSRVSVARMNNFLNTRELDPYVEKMPETGSSGEGEAVALLISDGSFSWSASELSFRSLFRPDCLSTN